MPFFKQGLVLLSCLSLLAACATPQVAEPVSEDNRAQSCAALAEEIRQADALRIAAREEDRFLWKYIFVVNGFVSAYRINKAEAAAEERIEGLKAIAQEKGCRVPELTAAPKAS